ncbi:hypothetical protein M6D81_31355 [Paenibacillus sp. J5C_2022]|nr:hypothetical protein [Paenibacillus sp. J5C2022]
MTYHLYHYYDEDIGPFRSLSLLSEEKAHRVFNRIRLEGNTFASRRSNDYMAIRKELEALAHDQFISKGGKPKSIFPNYMTLETCDWLKTWYKKPKSIVIPWDEFNDDSISFTYGDLFPTMRYQDDKPYRKKIYTRNEIAELIKKFGFPQIWNMDGNKGPERYIEAQIWDEEIIARYIH